MSYRGGGGNGGGEEDDDALPTAAWPAGGGGFFVGAAGDEEAAAEAAAARARRWRKLAANAGGVALLCSLVACLLAGVGGLLYYLRVSASGGGGEDVRSAFVLSDVHLNPLYNGSFAAASNCMAPAPNSSAPAGGPAYAFGRYGCDPPLALLRSAVAQMHFLDSNPLFIAVTGDLVAHHLPSRALYQQALVEATQEIVAAFPGISVVMAIGNNDVYPDYVLDLGPNPQLQFLADAWSAVLRPDELATFSAGGYYRRDISSGLTLLVLNSVIYSSLWAPAASPPEDVQPWADVSANPRAWRNYERARAAPPDSAVADPNNQFAWLVQQLDACRAAGSRVILVGHIPVGFSTYEPNLPNWHMQYQATYESILSNFSDVVINQFFAHYHTDEFRVMWEDGAAAPYSAVSISPSISPNHGNNPSVRRLVVDLSASAVVNYVQYYADLVLANLVGAPQWIQEYSFTDIYGVGAVDLPSYELLWSMLNGAAINPEAILRYVNYRSAMAIPNRNVVCALGTSDPAEYSSCSSSLAND